MRCDRYDIHLPRNLARLLMRMNRYGNAKTLNCSKGLQVSLSV